MPFHAQVELGQLVLKRFLLLVLLLDKAVAGCPKEAPLLFRRGQPLKSSSEVHALPALHLPIIGFPFQTCA